MSVALKRSVGREPSKQKEFYRTPAVGRELFSSLALAWSPADMGAGAFYAETGRVAPARAELRWVEVERPPTGNLAYEGLPGQEQ